MTERTIHEGRNVKRIREMLGIKQETLAADLNWSQQKISLLEQKENIDDAVLEEVAKILKVPVEAIKNFDEQAAVNIVSSTITNNDNSSVYGNYHFNPLDKVIELYERMLKDKDSMIEELKKLLQK
jgi:transcriptional regulator with XRE-family HTH domain